jgi:hypothetical protein
MGINCSSAIESVYYSSTMFLPPVCVHCGLQDNLLDDYDPYMMEMRENFSMVRPLCKACHNAGKDAKTWGKKFFKKQKK